MIYSISDVTEKMNAVKIVSNLMDSHSGLTCSSYPHIEFHKHSNNEWYQVVYGESEEEHQSRYVADLPLITYLAAQINKGETVTTL